MANAKRYGDDDLAKRCFRRLCELEGKKHSDPLHIRFWATMAAFEELLTVKNGKPPGRAGRVKC